jgi:hypothetical protein
VNGPVAAGSAGMKNFRRKVDWYGVIRRQAGKMDTSDAEAAMPTKRGLDVVSPGWCESQIASTNVTLHVCVLMDFRRCSDSAFWPFDFAAIWLFARFLFRPGDFHFDPAICTGPIEVVAGLCKLITDPHCLRLRLASCSNQDPFWRRLRCRHSLAMRGFPAGQIFVFLPLQRHRQATVWHRR